MTGPARGAGHAGTELVTFRLGERRYAVPLGGVREIVRLQGVRRLPGMRPPLAGVLDLRGVPLPVYDAREAAGPGDVLVLEPAGAGGPVGVAVDRVLEVGPPALQPAAGPVPDALPAYVLDVLLDGGEPVFVVDARAMCEAACPADCG